MNARYRVLSGTSVPFLGVLWAAALDLTPGGSPAWRAIDALYDLINAVGLIVLILVELLLVVMVLWYRRKGPEEPPEVSSKWRARWFMAFILVPFAILGAILVPTLQTMDELEKHPAPTMEIDVLALQWGWLVRYPDNSTEFNSLQVEEGTELQVTLRSDDVMHSLFVPTLGVKKDAIPGRAHSFHVTLDQQGVYPGACSEFCGIGHPDMPIQFVVFEKGSREKPYGPPEV